MWALGLVCGLALRDLDRSRLSPLSRLSRLSVGERSRLSAGERSRLSAGEKDDLRFLSRGAAESKSRVSEFQGRWRNFFFQEIAADALFKPNFLDDYKLKLTVVHNELFPLSIL